MIDGDVVVHEIELPAAPDDVFQMFVDPERLVRWIGITAELEPRPGGVFRFEVQPGQFCEGTYVEVEPPRRIVFTWGWRDPWFNLPPGTSRVEVDLTETPGGTHLRLAHYHLVEDVRALHDDGWSVFLRRLDAVVRGVEPGAYPAEQPASRQRELDARSESG